MSIKIALAGNPNSGKTTLFNALTGSSQSVGNWPGVTVEKKEGKLRGAKDVLLQDLPGVYSLSPYSLEEVVARRYLVNEKPDAILNIVDASSIERSLYLTTQLSELGVPMVVALNMIDVARKNGDEIDLSKLGEALGCAVVETSALRGEGGAQAAEKAVEAAKRLRAEPLHVFDGSVGQALARIEALTGSRWYAVKLFERDEKAAAELALPEDVREAIGQIVADCEAEMDDDAESIITNQRYAYIHRVVSACVRKGRPAGSLSASDKIDRVVTNRFLALPIFASVMFLVYSVSVTTIGALVTDFTNDVFVAEWIQAPVAEWLAGLGVAEWLTGLVVDGIIGGVGAVLGFVPQMFVLFFMLSILEDVGYMARIAFILDRVFRKFGLSGKSFIPMLIGTGCSVPGVMASRTIENGNDRRMTILTTPFIPCSAKMPIIGLIAGALFGGAGWVAASAYFTGLLAVILSGVTLKKTRLFAGDPSPFVMELPAYHAPSPRNVLHSMWERGWSFVKRAGTVILLSAVAIWFLQGYGWQNGAFGAVDSADHSILGRLGAVIAPVFAPLGFGDWRPTVATVLGLVAKEEVVNVLGILYNGDAALAEGFWAMSGGFGAWAAYAFLVFNLLCAPCFAAIGAIRREMNSRRWLWFAIGYQCAFAYAAALMVFQLGKLFSGAAFSLGAAAALSLLAGMLYLLLRKNPYDVKG